MDFGWCWIAPFSETTSQNLSDGLEDINVGTKSAILGMCPFSGHAHRHEVKKSWKQKKVKSTAKHHPDLLWWWSFCLKVGHVSLQMAFRGACDSSWLITNHGIGSKNGIQTKRHDEMIKEEFLVTYSSVTPKKGEPLNTTINHYLGSVLGWWWICSPKKCELYHGRFPANDVLLSCLSTGGCTRKTHIELKNCRCLSAEHHVFQIPFLGAFRTLNHNLSIHVPLQPHMRTSCSPKNSALGTIFP